MRLSGHASGEIGLSGNEEKHDSQQRPSFQYQNVT